MMKKKKSLLVLLVFSLLLACVVSLDVKVAKAEEYTETVCSKVVSLKDGFDLTVGDSEDDVWTIDLFNSSFGSQLDSTQKKIYNQIVKFYVTDKNTGKISITDVEKTFNSDNQSDVLADTFLAMQAAMDAMLKDYPQVYWINSWQMNVTKRLATDGTGKYYNLSIDPYPYYDAAISDREEVESAINTVKAEIDATINGSTRRDIILKAIYEKLVNIGTYDSSYKNASISHTPASLLLDKYNHLTICEGYAKTFKILCDRYNIPCVIVYGNTTGVGHMWNEVQMEDGKWYGIDLTWEENTEEFTYNYFLAGSNTKGDSSTFSNEHIPDGVFSKNSKEFSYPELASEKYVYSSSSQQPTTTASETTKQEITTEEFSVATTEVSSKDNIVESTTKKEETTVVDKTTAAPEKDATTIAAPEESTSIESMTEKEFGEETTTLEEETSAADKTTATSKQENANNSPSSSSTIKPQDNGSVNTGDSTQPLLYIAILAISGLVIFIIIIKSSVFFC